MRKVWTFSGIQIRSMGFIVLLSSGLSNVIFAQVDLRGQGIIQSIGSGSTFQSTLKYFPELDIQVDDFSASVSPQISYTQHSDANDVMTAYRAWLRYTTIYWEWKIGLQKINFGPAKILRALQWFDSLNPQDPSRQTTGVWAMKSRYTSSSNTSLYGWILYGNDKKKSMDIIQSYSDFPEFGGRFERMVGTGEFGLTTHYRVLDLGSEDKRPAELRIGVDGFMEYGVGLWFESSGSYILNSSISLESVHYSTLGCDYTIGAGNGLYVAGEGMIIHSRYEKNQDIQTVFAATASYSISWLDALNMYVMVLPESELAILSAYWQRTYDHFLILLGGYYSTDTFSGTTGPGQQNFTGTSGINFMVTLNH